LTSALALLTAAPAPGRADIIDGSYDKIFYTEGLKPTAKISAGALIETWAGDNLVDDTVTYKAAAAGPPPVKAVTDAYKHAISPTDNSPKTINGGLPVSDTRLTVDTGYHAGPISIPTDNHTDPNSASAEITVDGLLHQDPQVDFRNGKQGIDRRVLVDSVRTELKGEAVAGTPKPPVDTDKFHSADSFAAVEIMGGTTFTATPPPANGVPTLAAYLGSILKGGALGNQKEGQHLDPVFVTLTDQTTGVVSRQIVMEQSVTWTDATFSVDNTGITLTIDRNDPASSVALGFTNALPWVTNPYSYGATLDASGFTAFGETPLSGWTVTQGPDTTQAFFAFGPDGQPLDSAFVRPPDSQFTTGDTYSYDVGTGGGLFEVASAIPEPPVLVLSGVAALALLAWRRVRRRGSGGVIGDGVPGEISVDSSGL
jgi:hypothetical protein